MGVVRGQKGGVMTGKELIKWLQDNNALDLPIEVAYRDEGGYHYGTDKQWFPMIEEEDGYERVVL